MRNSFRCKNTLLDQPSDHLQTSWPSLEQIDHLEHADQPRPSWPPSPSQRWSEPRWWEGQALHSPLSSKPPQSRLKLLSLLRLTGIAVLNNINICTSCTPSNVTKYPIICTNLKLVYLYNISDWPDNSTSRGPAGTYKNQILLEDKMEVRSLENFIRVMLSSHCQDIFFNMVIFRCTSNNRTDFTPPHPNFPMPHSMYKHQEQ